MAILFKLNTKGSTTILQKKILILKGKTTASAIKRMTKTIPSSSSKSLNSLYSNIVQESKDTTNVVDTDITDVGSVFLKRRGKQVGSVTGNHRSPKAVIAAFTKGASNNILLSFPDIDKGNALVIRPTAKDLSAKKDGRTPNTWNIGLTTSAVTKYRNQLMEAVRKSTIDQLTNTVLGKKASGVTMKIAARLGVSADSITLVGTGGSIVGTDLTTLVRDEVARRMSKTGKSDEVLNYRSGDFVGSIKAKVATRNLITYTFDKKRYSAHEKTKGTITTIKAKPGKVMSFINKKTGDRVFTKSVKIPARPVIRESIRTVALKLYNKKFNMGLR